MTTQSADPMVGRLLDGRYQVRSRIARGGMATVYLATDLRLERRVAIKVMHGHLADDSDYKARFIQEARSAARLAHPNVVNVYDQGQDLDTAYLVMEYLPGITLRDLLTEHRVLTTMQALDIMEAVLAGLAAAHRGGIVHRDLKPENVLLADDGRIKISDFGLARAAHANTATGGALLGTIAYLSPELVTRGVADARSDIYALGIMLYEMLVGQQPFQGEQPFQIAHQHANESVPPPSAANPAVPQQLDELVLWATAREPDERPADAREMLDQLLAIRRDFDEHGAFGAGTANQTMVLSPAIAGATGETQVITPTPRTGTVRAAKAPRGRASGNPTEDLGRRSSRRRSRGYWLFGLVILLAGLAGGTGWYFGSGPGSLVTIPAVAGETPEAAEARLVAVGLTVAAERVEQFSADIPAGQVIDTDPAAGQAVAQQGLVKLIVSTGPEPLPVPTLAGLPEDQAAAEVTAARFTLEPSRYQFDDSVAEGLVLDAFGVVDGQTVSLPAGGTYGDQQPVTLLVSLGPIPDVSDRTVAEATGILGDAGLAAVEGPHEFHAEIEAGRVIRAQRIPDSGPLTQGGSVHLVISDGVEQVEVPDVEGMVWSQAQAKLTELGFSIEFARGASESIGRAFPGASTVRSIDPGVGETVDKGSTVTVRLQIFG